MDTSTPSSLGGQWRWHGRPAAHGEGGDLSARELRHIERHLANCATCRQYRASMDQALGALAVAATEIADCCRSPFALACARAHGLQVAMPMPAPLWPKAARGSADRSVRPWGDLDGARPLRQAWTHDTIREAMTGAKPTED